MRLKCGKLIRSWLPIFVALCIVVAPSARIQESAEVQSVEEDYLVTGIDARQRAVVELRKS